MSTQTSVAPESFLDNLRRKVESAFSTAQREAAKAQSLAEDLQNREARIALLTRQVGNLTTALEWADTRGAVIEERLDVLHRQIEFGLVPEQLDIVPSGPAWQEAAANVYSSIHGLELAKQDLPKQISRIRAKLKSTQSELATLQGK